MAQASGGHGLILPLRVKPLSQYRKYTDLCGSRVGYTDRPFVSVIKLEPARNAVQQNGSKPKSTTPQSTNQELPHKQETHHLKFHENLAHCGSHNCVKTDPHKVSVFTSVGEALKTLPKRKTYKTLLVCLEDVFRTLPNHLTSVKLAHVNKLMNHSQSEIQKQHQENFEEELKKRLQRKSPVEKIYKDSSMETTEEGYIDVYCDTPVKQNSTSTGKRKPKGKKVLDGQSPRSSPAKQSPKKKIVSDQTLACDGIDGINKSGAQDIREGKGKKKGKGSPSKKDTKSMEGALTGDYTNTTPEKQIIKRKKPTVKIDYSTTDIETISTSYTPSPDSCSRRSSLNLSLTGMTSPGEGKELHVYTNHNDSANSSFSASLQNSGCSTSSLEKESKPVDSPSSLSPSKELGRRIRAPNIRYSDDILLLPLKSPRRSRSPKGSAEKDGASGGPDESSTEHNSAEKIKKSSESQTSQLYSLLTNKGQLCKSVTEKSPVTDSDQNDTKGQPLSLLSQSSMELPLINGLVDDVETESVKSSEKPKKRRKKKFDSVTAEKSKPKSMEKSEKKKGEKVQKIKIPKLVAEKIRSPKLGAEKVKSPKSGAIRALQFDEGVEETSNTGNKEEETAEKTKETKKGRKAGTPKKPRKTPEKGRKAAANSSSEVLESVNQAGDSPTSSKSKSENINTLNLDSNRSKSLNLFSLIAKVKDNMSTDTFPMFADEVLLKAEEDDNNKEDLNENSESDPKPECEKSENNSQSLEIVDDFFSADFLKVSPKHTSKSPSREKPKHNEPSVSEEPSAKPTSAKLESILANIKTKKTSLSDGGTIRDSACENPLSMQTKTVETMLKEDEHIKDGNVGRLDGKVTAESTSSFDPSVPLLIDTQERRNIFDAIMTDYPSPNNIKEKKENSEKQDGKSECDRSSTDMKVHSDIKATSPRANENLSLSLQGEISVIEKIQVKLGIPLEESPKKQKISESSDKCDSPKKQSEIIKSPTKSTPSLVKRTSLGSREDRREHNSTKGSSDFEVVMDTVDEHQMIMDVDYESHLLSPSEEKACSSRPVPRTSTQRVTKEPTPLSVLSSIEGEVQDKMCAFTSSVLDEYLDTKTNRKVKLSRPIKRTDSEERLVDSEDELEEVAEMPEQYDEFSGMIEQCEPSFDEVDGVLFTSFANEEALNAHVKVEKKTKIGRNESILLGMARMKNLRERQNQIRNSVHQKKDARLKALKEQYKINQSLQGMHLVLLKYQRVFKRELILELMAKEQESPGSIQGKTPKKTSDITQIKGWKNKFGADGEALEMKASKGKLHWRTEERLLRNHDQEQLKQMGLDLKKKRRKNLVFTIRKGMSKGDPSRMEKVDLTSHTEEEGGMEGGETKQDGENSFGQELVEMGYEILDNEKQKLRDKKMREKYKKYLMMKLKLNNEDIDILKKLGGQRLRSVLKSESPKKVAPPPPPTPPPTEEGDKDGDTTTEGLLNTPTKKKRKRKKNYFCIITLNSSMANAALTALHPKFVVKKKKAKAVKAIKKEVVDPEVDKQSKGGAKEKAGDKTEDTKTEESENKEDFDKMCDKPGCRYGCICHLCKFSGGSPETADLSNIEKKCTKEYCRLGCICDDNLDKVSKHHCGKPECMLECTCDPVARRRNSRSSSQGEKPDSGVNSEDSLSTTQEEGLIKKPGKKNQVIPQRKSTYRLAKNLDAVSRKAMLVYEASEKFESQKTRTRKKQDSIESTPNLTVEHMQKQQAISIPPAEVSTAAPVPQKKPQLTTALVPTPGLPVTGPVTIAIPQPKVKPTPIQTEMYRKAAVTIKSQWKKAVDDSEMALFESDSETEDIQELISCARVDAQYTRGYHPKKCTCGKEHVQSRAVSSQCPLQGGGQMASSGLSALQQRLTGKTVTETVWQTQWVCLKSNKPLAEGDSVKLLEILSNCNWEPHKQKILSRISRQIHHKNQPEGQSQADSYPQPCLIHIGEFEIEFLPKSSKPATIPPEVRNNMPSAIFSIRVRISVRDLNFPKLFKALPLDSTVRNKNTLSTLPDKVNILNTPPQPMNVSASDGDMNKSSLGVTGISGFSRLQINNRSIVNKDGNSSTDRSHLHPISTQQMTHMMPSQLLTPLQTLPVTIQSSGSRLVTPQTVTVTKVLPPVPTVSPSVTTSSAASQSVTTSSLTSVSSTKITNFKNQESSSSVISSIGQPSTQPLKSVINLVPGSSAPQKTTVVMSSEKPVVSAPIISTTVSSKLGAIITSSMVPSQTHPTSNPINVIATSVITATTSITTDKPVTSISVIKQSPGQSSQSTVSKSTLVSLHSVLQNKAVSSSSTLVAKPLYLATPILPSTETKVSVGNNTMQVHDLRPPASLSMTQVQEKVCVLGPKSSPVTLLGPFTSPSSIPKVLPQMKIIQSSILDKDGKPVIHLVPFTGSMYGKPSPMTSVLKNSSVVNSGAQQTATVGGIKNPTNVYTLSDVSTTTTNVAHVSNASTTVTQSTVPAMSEKVQGPLLPKLGDQILLVSSDEQNLKLLNKLKVCDNPRILNDNNKKLDATNNKVNEECNETEKSRDSDVPQQSNAVSVSVKRKLEGEIEEEKKKLKTSDNEVKKFPEGGANVKENDSVLAKILLSDSIIETYSKYRDIKADMKENTKGSQEETPFSNQEETPFSNSNIEINVGSKKDEESKTSGTDNSKDSNQEDIEKTQEGESESDCGSPDNRRPPIGVDPDSSCDKSDESDATVVGGIEADQKDSEVENGEKMETTGENSKEDQKSEPGEQISKSGGKQSTEEPVEPEVIHILDSPVKKPTGNTKSDNGTPVVLDKSETEATDVGSTVGTNGGVTSIGKESGLSLKRRLSQEEAECNKKSRTEEKAEESEEDLCMTVEDTDDMAVIIPNEDCVEIINSSDEEIDIETETDINMNKLLRKQSDNTWEFFNPNCNVHCINKKPHAKRKSNHKTISNVLKDDFHFKEGVLADPKTRRIQMKKSREKQRREEMRISFKALAESMYGEDKDDTKYSQILNHTEPKVQLLNKAKEKIDYMEGISHTLTSENKSTLVRNSQLKSRLQSLKEYIIKERGMPWMVLQAHLDKISKVCKKIFQNMPAILKKRAMDRRASTGSSGNVPTTVRLSSPFARPGLLSRPPVSPLASSSNGPVPIQMVSSEQVRSMAKSQELARSKENLVGRPDIYIDYAEEENEICEDLMRREEKNRRKQIHEVNINDDISFEIGDLPSLFKKTDYLGSYSLQEGKVVNNSPALKSEALNNLEGEDEKVIIADEYDDSGKMTVYRLNSTNPIVEVPMSSSGKIVSSETPESEPPVYDLEDHSREEETPMLVITEVKSLSSDH